MAQGELAVVQPADLRLSALPPDEKCKIWNEEQSLLAGYSDEEIEWSKSAKQAFNWLVLNVLDNHWLVRVYSSLFIT